MKDITTYTKDDLTSLTLISYYKIMALETFITHIFSTMPDLIAKAHFGSLDEKPKTSSELKDAITNAIQHKMIDLIMKDERIADSLKQELKIFLK